MKMIQSLFFIFVFLTTLACATPATESTYATNNNSGGENTSNGDASVVLNLVIHIENDASPDVDDLIEAINTLATADIPVSLGADFDWLNDESRADEVLDAVIAGGGVLDIHAHGSTLYNRADIANTLIARGYTITEVASGIISTELNEITSAYDPLVVGTTSWQASYCWGLATPGHTSDQLFWGIDRETISSALPIIGGGVGNIDDAQTLIDEVLAGSHAGKLMTASVNLQPLTLLAVDSTDSVADILSFHTSSIAQGAQWLTLEATGQLADSNFTGEDSRVDVE